MKGLLIGVTCWQECVAAMKQFTPVMGPKATHRFPGGWSICSFIVRCTMNHSQITVLPKVCLWSYIKSRRMWAGYYYGIKPRLGTVDCDSRIIMFLEWELCLDTPWHSLIQYTPRAMLTMMHCFSSNYDQWLLNMETNPTQLNLASLATTTVRFTMHVVDSGVTT